MYKRGPYKEALDARTPLYRATVTQRASEMLKKSNQRAISVSVPPLRDAAYGARAGLRSIFAQISVGRRPRKIIIDVGYVQLAEPSVEGLDERVHRHVVDVRGGGVVVQPRFLDLVAEPRVERDLRQRTSERRPAHAVIATYCICAERADAHCRVPCLRLAHTRERARGLRKTTSLFLADCNHCPTEAAPAVTGDDAETLKMVARPFRALA